MASGSAHVRAEAAKQHVHLHAHPTSHSHALKPAQLREVDYDAKIGPKASRRPATARLDLSYASNARPLVRSLSAHSPSTNNFLDLGILSGDLEREGMDSDELHSVFRGWSFDKGNVKLEEGVSTRVIVSNYYIFHFGFIFPLAEFMSIRQRLASRRAQRACQDDLHLRART